MAYYSVRHPASTLVSCADCRCSFYILSLLFVGLLVPYNDDRLLGANPFIDVAASPFVIAANDAGLKGFDSFINVVILISVISIGLSGVYGGSRTLTALAEQGYAPKIFTYVDKAGRPLWSTIAILVCALLAYINLDEDGQIVFDWLVALSGLAALFTWGSICLAHIRFRAAWAYHGHSVDEIPFHAVGGVYGSWLGFILIVLVLIAQVSLPFHLAISYSVANIAFLVLYCRLASRGRRQRCRGLLQVLPCPFCRHFLLDLRLLLEKDWLAQAVSDRRRQRPS